MCFKGLGSFWAYDGDADIKFLCWASADDYIDMSAFGLIIKIDILRQKNLLLFSQ